MTPAKKSTAADGAAAGPRASATAVSAAPPPSVPHETPTGSAGLRRTARRVSSVGNINVGDTAPGLSTMHVSRSSRRRSDARIMELNTASHTDFAIAKKIVLGFNELSYRQTWIKPLILIAISLVTFAVSSPDSDTHRVLRAMILPSYRIPGTDLYAKGVNDFYFVLYYSLVFTFTREFTMCCVLRPTARWAGIKTEAKIRRFMEQTYSILYYGVTGPVGLYIMYGLPLWFFKTTPMFETYPHKTHDWLFKTYYLGQAAFWVQQSGVLALQLEKPRKDFKELVLHHIITIALIWCSYRFHFTWIGLPIFISMDISDYFLAISKTLNYLDSKFAGPFFIFFAAVWVYLRHYLNLLILWSVLTEFKSVGDFELNWETEQYKCSVSQPLVFILMASLQVVNIYWLFLIGRVAWRYAIVGVPEDERSDDEEEEEEEDSKE